MDKHKLLERLKGKPEPDSDYRTGPEWGAFWGVSERTAREYLRLADEAGLLEVGEKLKRTVMGRLVPVKAVRFKKKRGRK